MDGWAPNCRYKVKLRRYHGEGAHRYRWRVVLWRFQHWSWPPDRQALIPSAMPAPQFLCRRGCARHLPWRPGQRPGLNWSSNAEADAEARFLPVPRGRVVPASRVKCLTDTGCSVVLNAGGRQSHDRPPPRQSGWSTAERPALLDAALNGLAVAAPVDEGVPAPSAGAGTHGNCASSIEPSSGPRTRRTSGRTACALRSGGTGNGASATAPGPDPAQSHLRRSPRSRRPHGPPR
jgi:hypothetical protein